MAAVLIVDDDPELSQLLKRLLGLSGYDAACVADGRAALAYLATDTPRLMILDMMMPEMDGLDVLRAVQADARCRGVTVLMYSAADDPTERQAAYDLGAKDYLIKGQNPFDDLLYLVERYAGAPH